MALRLQGGAAACQTWQQQLIDGTEFAGRIGDAPALLAAAAAAGCQSKYQQLIHSTVLQEGQQQRRRWEQQQAQEAAREWAQQAQWYANLARKGAQQVRVVEQG